MQTEELDVQPSGSSAPLLDNREPLPQADGLLGRISTLEVRLARSQEEIGVAQEIRYRVFFEELIPLMQAGRRVYGMTITLPEELRFEPWVRNWVSSI